MNEFTLAGATKGNWEWVSTTTPTRTFMPQTLGYSKQLSVSTDTKGAYIGFYKRDTLQQRLYETSSDTLHTFVEDVHHTVLIKKRGAGFITYRHLTTTGAVFTMTVSGPLTPYSP